MKRFFRWIAVPLAMSAVFTTLFITCLGSSKMYRSSASALAGQMEPAPVAAARGEDDGVDYEREAPPPPPAMKRMKVAPKGYASRAKEEAKMAMMAAAPAAEPGEAAASEGAASAPTRAWFPETFLFEPLVVTDDAGRATVPVRVPDRLTRWHVLALAHSRSGAQAGAVTSFLGTLPTYVDPVIPGFLLAGDEVRLPIQMVNTTKAEVATPLKIEAVGAAVGGAPASARIPAEGSRVEYVTLRTSQPGKVALKATLGSTDAVVREVDVQPSGRPILQTTGGTLAAPRTVELSGPADALPQSQRVRLLVYPGALAVLRAELAAATNRGGDADDAYALLLSGKAAELLRSLGDEPDADALRTLRVISTQRAVRLARSPSTATATLLAEAALSHPDQPLLARLGERMAATVASAQRPDGTCQGGDGWTLQRLLVTTADCVRAVRAASDSQAAKNRAAAVAIRASGAFERYLDQVQDGYTAAAILASGSVTGAAAEKLRTVVRDGLKQRTDGTQVLGVDASVQRPDGERPSEEEATALAVLALQGDAKAPLADLGAAVLGGYRASSGWGDGRANLVCLQAVLALFKERIPPNVKILLQMDGKTVTEGTLDAKALREVLALEAAAPGATGPHTWTIRADPPVPGLGYSLALQSWVPWKKETASGLELSVKTAAELRVGQPAEVDVAAAVPAGLPVKIRHALPAGVQPDTASLDALVSNGTISRYETEDGAISLEVPGKPPGQTFAARYRVIPTLAGTLHAPASSIAPLARSEQVSYVPSGAWSVR